MREERERYEVIKNERGKVEGKEKGSVDNFKCRGNLVSKIKVLCCEYMYQ